MSDLNKPLTHNYQIPFSKNFKVWMKLNNFLLNKIFVPILILFFGSDLKDKTEKPCTGKTVKNDRRNYCNWLILALKDTWHYEKDWESSHKFVKMLFYFWGDWKWKNKNHKHTKFSKLSNFVILLGKFFCYM